MRDINSKKFCSKACEVFVNLKKKQDNDDVLFKQISELCNSNPSPKRKKVKQTNILIEKNLKCSFDRLDTNAKSIAPVSPTVLDFRWDMHAKSHFLILNKKGDFLSNLSADNRFKSATSYAGYSNGVHLLKVRAAIDESAEVILGFVRTKMFNTENAFNYNSFGYGLSNLGIAASGNDRRTFDKLRTYSDYYVVIKLDMLQGTIGYSLDDGDTFDTVFNCERLKLGPIYFAAAMRNLSKITLI